MIGGDTQSSPKCMAFWFHFHWIGLLLQLFFFPSWTVTPSWWFQSKKKRKSNFPPSRGKNKTCLIPPPRHPLTINLCYARLFPHPEIYLGNTPQNRPCLHVRWSNSNTIQKAIWWLKTRPAPTKVDTFIRQFTAGLLAGQRLKKVVYILNNLPG